MTPRGLISPTLIIALGGALVVAGSLGYAKLQSSRLDALRAEYTGFKAQVKANGEAAEKQAKLKEAQDAKQIQDALTQRDVALKRLRQSGPPSRPVSDNSAGPGAGQTICIPTPTYNAAMGEFGKQLARGVAEARRLTQEGDAAQIDAVTLIQSWPLKMSISLNVK